MKERVLIVDDESSMLAVLSRYVSALNHECVTTTFPQQALNELRPGAFSLLITDMKMPEMSGMEVLRQARVIDPDLAVIVVTGLTDVSNAIQAMRDGADDYLLKPFTFADIALAVSKAFEKRNTVLTGRRQTEDLSQKVTRATEELERINRELRETKQYLENLLHSTVDAIMTADTSGKIDFVNGGALRMLGCAYEDIIGRPVAHYFVGGNDEIRMLRRRLQKDRPLQNYETELKRKDGVLVPVNMSLSLVCDAGGEVVSALAICKDITQQKTLERELKEMSIKDSLTGLYNQRYFYDRLRGEIERARRQGHPLSLLLLDIDQFKRYNDSRGHLEGDKVLQVLGKVIFECTRDHVDMGFRYGGDEFIVVLPEADEAQALLIAERIRKSFEARRFDHLTLSIGLKSYRDGDTDRSFIHFTDSMMYDAKRSGGNSVTVYNADAEATEEGVAP